MLARLKQNGINVMVATISIKLYIYIYLSIYIIYLQTYLKESKSIGF